MRNRGTIYEDARRDLGRSGGHIERPGEIQEDPGWEMQRGSWKIQRDPGEIQGRSWRGTGYSETRRKSRKIHENKERRGNAEEIFVSKGS
jgi:hypothetical protein